MTFDWFRSSIIDLPNLRIHRQVEENDLRSADKFYVMHDLLSFLEVATRRFVTDSAYLRHTMDIPSILSLGYGELSDFV